MSTALQIPVSEYLRTVYRPDREYLDGEVRERNVGKWEHARLQALLAIFFGSQESAWGVMAATEQRVQVSATRVRIPDVVLVPAGRQPDVLVEAPLLVIEILSPDDTYSEMQERTSDYLQMGVTTIWIIDPKTRTGRMCMGDIWKAATHLLVPGTSVQVSLDDLFQRLDRSW